jgi:hypothetical protein
VELITYENWGRVIHHGSDGFSVVQVTDEAGTPLHMRPFEMPTLCIPFELRPIGSRFLFEWDGIRVDETDSTESLREHCRTMFRV